MCHIDEATPGKPICACPEIRSTSAGAALSAFNVVVYSFNSFGRTSARRNRYARYGFSHIYFNFGSLCFSWQRTYHIAPYSVNYI